METPLPDPQLSETPAGPAPRWCWLENRWLALLVTVLISGMSVTLVEAHWTWTTGNLGALYMNFVKACCAKVGLPVPVFLSLLPIICASLWFVPFALQLGWWRAQVWLGLTVIGAAIGFSFLDLLQFMPLLLPCAALIGRRTRPWMALPATAAFVFVAILNIPFDVRPRHLLLVVGLAPYAAILIFGTKLIPKRPATAAQSD